MRYLSTFFLAILITAASLPAHAEVLAQRPLSADGVVEVETFSGSIRLIGWDEAKIEVSGTVSGGTDRLEVEGGEDRAVISVMPGEDPDTVLADADLEIRVPKKCRVVVETISGSIKAVGLAGRVSLESISGRIDIEGSPSEAEISTVSGAITLEGDATMREGNIETVSGNIDAKIGIHPSGRLDFETVSGIIDLRIPKGAAAQIEAETFSGDIDNELGPEPEKSSSFLPSQELSFTLGSGGAHVSLTSFSGAIHIRGT